MLKKAAFAGLGLVFVLSPLVASADTASELRAKIDALLAQVAQLKEQLIKVESGTNPIACTEEARICPDGSSVGRTGPNCAFAACPGVTQPPRRCVPILRALQKGSRGAEVTALQEFLIERGDLETEATGYFGVATEAAVANLQFENDVIASDSPVAVGRGVVGPRTRAVIAEQCANPKPNLSASPKTGLAPLTVSFQTFRGGTSIDYGDGTSVMLSSLPILDCLPNALRCPVRVVSHIYTSVGTYVAKLIESNPGGCSPAAEAQGCLGGPASVRTLGSAVIRVGTGGNTAAPSISGVSGPSTLTTGRSGTWKVSATASGGNLSYSVVWGDEEIIDQIRAYGDLAQSVQSSATFTHAYSRAGTYKPVFTVANRIGSAKASASVVVSGNTITPDCLAPDSVNGGNPCPGGGSSGSSGGTINSNGVKITPASGAAPLTVTTEFTTGTCSSYSVSWGDGRYDTYAYPSASPICNEMAAILKKTHTYSVAGTYSVIVTVDGTTRGSGIVTVR